MSVCPTLLKRLCTLQLLCRESFLATPGTKSVPMKSFLSSSRPRLTLQAMGEAGLLSLAKDTVIRLLIYRRS